MKTIDKYTGDGQINLDSNIKNAYGNSNNDSTWNRQESASAKKDQNCCSGCMQSFSNLVVGILERAFYRLGYFTGKHPYLTICITFLLTGLCAIGMIRLTLENRTHKLWNAENSYAQKNKRWVDSNFPKSTFVSSVIFESDDVLTTRVLLSTLEARKRVLMIYNGTDMNWEKICYRPGRDCVSTELLEIWAFDETSIKALTKSDILNAVNNKNLLRFSIDELAKVIKMLSSWMEQVTLTLSGTPGHYFDWIPMYHLCLGPLTGRRIQIERLLGGVVRSNNNTIIKARALSSHYFLKNRQIYNPKTGDMEDVQAEAWEKEFVELFETVNFGVKIYSYSQSVFDNTAEASIFKDLPLAMAGYCVMVLYLSFMLGRVTKLRHKAWLALIGIICIGCSLLASCGLSSAFGFVYTSVHSIIPFLILGVGIDDVFVIVQSWKVVIASTDQESSVPLIMAKTLKHAGVAITVTSMTDIMAFAMGATTVLPALESFCAFAGIGILIVFAFNCTMFTACLALDTYRMRKRKDACLCCITVPTDYEPTKCASHDYLQWLFENIWGKYLLKTPSKIIVIVITLLLFGVNIYGVLELKQEFILEDFVPADSPSKKYMDAKAKYFPSEGMSGMIYLGRADYFKEQDNLHKLYQKIRNNKYVSEKSVLSWYEEYKNWINKTKGNGSTHHNNLHLKNERIFYSWLAEFLNATEGQSFRSDLELVYSGSNSSKIMKCCMHYTHIDMPDAKTEVEAMDSLNNDVYSVPINGMRAFPYCEWYIWWETNKIIRFELFRNLGLAGACVFIVIAILIANLWTSVMVFTCVIFTLVDVGGLMYFWGLHIDTVSTIVLILCTGLCVDYAAHIGHSFMVSRKGGKTERAASALNDIGPAVLNGGLSTFLGIILMSASKSYVFLSFFKVFFLAILFGQFHGLVYFPVLLSWIGPKPYSPIIPNHTTPAKVHSFEENPHLADNKEVSHGNEEMKTENLD